MPVSSVVNILSSEREKKQTNSKPIGQKDNKCKAKKKQSLEPNGVRLVGRKIATHFYMMVCKAGALGRKHLIFIIGINQSLNRLDFVPRLQHIEIWSCTRAPCLDGYPKTFHGSLTYVCVCVELRKALFNLVTPFVVVQSSNRIMPIRIIGDKNAITYHFVCVSLLLNVFNLID